MHPISLVAAVLLASGEPQTIQLTVGLVRVSPHRPGSDKPWDTKEPKPKRDLCSALGFATGAIGLVGAAAGTMGVGTVAGAATATKVGGAADKICQVVEGANEASPTASTDPDLFVRVVGAHGAAFRSYTVRDTFSHSFDFRVDVPVEVIPASGLEVYVQNDSGVGADGAQEVIGLLHVTRKQLLGALHSDGLLTLSDMGGGLERLELKVTEAPASRKSVGTLDVAKGTGAFNDLAVNAGDVVEVVAEGEYRVGGTLTKVSGLPANSLNYTDEPFRSGPHGAAIALAGSGGQLVGAIATPVISFLARNSGVVVVGINDRERRGNSGDLGFVVAVRPATPTEWETGNTTNTRLKLTPEKLASVEKVISRWSDEAVKVATSVASTDGQAIAAAVQRITHPTGHSPTLKTANVTVEGETVAVLWQVTWLGGLSGQQHETDVRWEFDDLRHIKAAIIADSAPVRAAPTNAAQLDRYFAEKLFPLVREKAVTAMTANAEPHKQGAEPTVAQPESKSVPMRVGDCVVTTIKRVGFRLETAAGVGSPGSGTAIKYDNGLYQVSYKQEADADISQAGDEVNLCLVEVPKGCPPGDGRGKVYKGTNRRTGKSWQMADSQHSCGGA